MGVTFTNGTALPLEQRSLALPPSRSAVTPPPPSPPAPDLILSLYTCHVNVI